MVENEFCKVCGRQLIVQHERAIGIHTVHLIKSEAPIRIESPHYAFQGEDGPDIEPEME